MNREFFQTWKYIRTSSDIIPIWGYKRTSSDINELGDIGKKYRSVLYGFGKYT